MQIPGSVLASRQIILLGTINWFVLLNLNPIPHTAEFKNNSCRTKTVREDLDPHAEVTQSI